MQQNSETKSQTDWKNLIAEQENSGLSQKEFCNQRVLVLSQFVYHRCSSKNKNTQTTKPALKPVKIVGNEHHGDIRLSLPNGFQCSFSCSLDMSQGSIKALSGDDKYRIRLEKVNPSLIRYRIICKTTSQPFHLKVY